MNKQVEGLPEELVEQFRSIPTAAISDAMGRCGSMSAAIKPISPRAKLVGPALTIRTDVNDTLMVHLGIRESKAGDVLVIDGGGYENGAIWGGNASLFCKTNGIEGSVVDGATRDVDDIQAMGYPVFARCIVPRGGFRSYRGSININVTISCGGIAVSPGDIVIGDSDGVVIVPKENAVSVLESARAIVLKEEQIRQRVMKGETLFDIYEIEKYLSK